jgi:acyl-coenzyme A thioesterase PaaI-like protein
MAAARRLGRADGSSGAVPVKQPNSAFCFVCGLDNPVGLKLAFYETGPDEVTALWTPGREYEGFPGVLHGGIVASILDEAGGRVVMIGDHTHFMMTATLDVKYRRRTPIGQPLRVIGRLLKRRRRLAFVHAEIQLANGSVTAEAELTLADLPDSMRVPGDLEALGWKVYADHEA